METLSIEKKILRKAALFIGLILIGALCYFVYDSQETWEEIPASGQQDAESSLAAIESREEETAESVAEARLMGVHVTGAVAAPDQVYWLSEGARVADAIKAAGGALQQADLSQLNLAAYVSDGQQIYVPEQGEEVAKAQNSLSENTQTPLTNINLATKIELMELPGIGEVYAQRIIDYREEHGPFTSIEDLMQVKGIGENKFAELQDYITVE